ncbi:MAG: cupin [Candidatus Electrothrix sp. GM3_4]|nr:cupin [Candidatus Electrothrix sp. GM3_4]
MKNIFTNLPSELQHEQLDELLRVGKGQNIRIERIVSKGHTSPETGWYDQEEDEWVLVLEGAGTLLFAEDNRRMTLRKGDYLHIGNALFS